MGRYVRRRGTSEPVLAGGHAAIYVAVIVVLALLLWQVLGPVGLLILLLLLILV